MHLSSRHTRRCILEVPRVRGGTGRYRAVQGATGRYKVVQGGTGRYRALHGAPRLCRALQGATGRYGAVQGATGALQGSTGRYRALQGGLRTGHRANQSRSLQSIIRATQWPQECPDASPPRCPHTRSPDEGPPVRRAQGVAARATTGHLWSKKEQR